jgi:hypothetical protein
MDNTTASALITSPSSNKTLLTFLSPDNSLTPVPVFNTTPFSVSTCSALMDISSSKDKPKICDNFSIRITSFPIFLIHQTIQHQ